ncbi:MAG: CcmD family protein [Terriglobales bacterium]
MGSLVAAYSVAWIILMVYVFTLAARQRRLRRALNALEETGRGTETHGSAAGGHGR